jgi:TetR/AcrR family transcriptional regulator, regulator of cefoperazone and chloramphenicol sensitivity
LRQDTARTRKGLLAAASEIFAEKGYRDATIAEISERAGTNVASVNYHFGDKETLYREAWRQSFRDSIEAHPPDGGVAGSATPKQRLQGRIVALVRRITDENNREFLIVHKELANPTGLLEEVTHKEIGPLRQEIEASVRAVVGKNGSKEQVRHCAISIISQCVFPAFINMSEKLGNDSENDSWRVEDIESYAEHVVTFSLAGMRAIRNGTLKGVRQKVIVSTV